MTRITKYKPGEIVIITNNFSSHGFSIGEKVRLEQVKTDNHMAGIDESDEGIFPRRYWFSHRECKSYTPTNKEMSSFLSKEY